MDVSQQLAWEARQRLRMALAAGAAGILSFAGATYVDVKLGTPPQASVLDSLARLDAGRPLGGEPSLRLPFFDFVRDNVGTLITSAVISSAGLLLLGSVLFFLARATRARVTPYPRLALTLPLIGSVAFATGLILSAVGTGRFYDSLLAARTVDGVQNAGADGLLITGQSINLAGALSLGAGTIVVCMQAMRAGLLTRFMGVLGILCGGLLALSPFLGSGFSPVQAFWLVALGVLLSGRWPGGLLPAWRTGTAVPWPSAAEVREARAGTPELGEDPPARPERETGGPSPATSAKKKRKRRG